MRQWVQTVFDDFVIGGATSYSSTTYNDQLGSSNQLALQAVADTVTGTATLTVAIEHSNDGRN